MGGSHHDRTPNHDQVLFVQNITPISRDKFRSDIIDFDSSTVFMSQTADGAYDNFLLNFTKT